MANTTGNDRLQMHPWNVERQLRLPAAVPGSTTTFYDGQAVGRDASGNLVQMDDTAKAEFVGILEGIVRVDVLTSDSVATNGVAGDKTFDVIQPLLFKALIASAAGGDEGRRVYWKFNNEVSYSPGANGNLAGSVWHVPDGTHVVVLPPWIQGSGQGGDIGTYTRAATGTVTLTKFDANKVVVMPLTAAATTNLPAAASLSPGDKITFLNTSANSSAPTLAAAGADTINGAATYVQSTTQYSAAVLRTDGVSKWYVEVPGPSGTVGATTFSGNVGVSSATLTVTATSTDALDVGQNGATNPALKIDTNTASSATGLSIKSAAAGAGLALAVISSGTNENLTENAKGSGTITIGGISTGLVSIGRGSVSTAIFSSTKTSIATQNSTPTAAQLLGGYIAHASTTGSGTATLDTAANIDTAIPGVATGDSFQCVYSNTGTQTVTITTAAGLTLKGTAAIPTLKTAVLDFFRTGSAAWDVVITVSA